MEFVYITLGIAAVIGILVVLLILAADTGNPFWLVLLILYISALIALAVIADIEEGKKGPCVKHETVLMYNAATKTNMPAKICVERGEWVTENE